MSKWGTVRFPDPIQSHISKHCKNNNLGTIALPPAQGTDDLLERLQTEFSFEILALLFVLFLTSKAQASCLLNTLVLFSFVFLEDDSAME